MVVDTVGLVVVRAPVWNEYLNDTIPVGDTLVRLMWGQAEDSDIHAYRVWWRGLIEGVGQFWDPTGRSGAQSLREPRWSSWVRMAFYRRGKTPTRLGNDDLQHSDNWAQLPRVAAA